MPFMFATSAAATSATSYDGPLPTPPAGWRSWNQMAGKIDQPLLEAIMDGLADSSRLVDGKPTSLLDLGYSRIGMDDGWQACGTGINGSFHAADGTPLWNTTAFPDVKAMNDKAHKLGLKSDWYINNCICTEKLSPGFAQAGNAKALAALGFDGVKIDGCGVDHNVTDFVVAAEAALAGARPLTVEDCNDDPAWDRGSVDTTAFYSTGCAASGGGFYRIGGDIFGNWEAILARVQQMWQHVQPTPWHEPIARPGCWPTPDALEVGCSRQGPLGHNATEARSHFGLWAVTSSPLILGLDLRDAASVDFAWPIIANPETLAVNRAWPASYLGTNSTPSRLVATDGVYYHGTLVNITWMAWAKNVSDGPSGDLTAVLLLNAGDETQDVRVALQGVLPAAARGKPLWARDLWARKDLGAVDDTSTWTAAALKPHDSVFVQFSADKAVAAAEEQVVVEQA